jgi:hypothetical protein
VQAAEGRMVDSSNGGRKDSVTMSMVSHSVSISAGLSSGNKLAPIALFVYNRPEHTQSTVNALLENELAAQSDLFVFSDGPKGEAGSVAVQRVRTYMRGIQGFKSVTIIERDQNWGLANSVIAGVTKMCDEFGRVIAMEDDLLTTPDFLTFMNQALKRYETEPRIFSVSGFNFGFNGPEHHEYDAFCFYRSSSLGWATWKNRWDLADWKISDYNGFCTDREQQRQFGRGGDDLSHMLALQMHGEIDSWAIRWAYAHFKQDALALLSFRPRVFHIGSDGAATYSRRKSFKQLPLTEERKSEFRYPDAARIEEDFVRELQRLLRPSLARKLVRYLRYRGINLKTEWTHSPRVLPAKTEGCVAPEPSRRSILD